MDTFILLNSDIKRLFPTDSYDCKYLLMLYLCNNCIWAILLNSMNIQKRNIIGSILKLLPIFHVYIKGVDNFQNSRDNPQKAIVPVGRPRPYYIIILNMRFIPKASLRASSQITASSYILERQL